MRKIFVADYTLRQLAEERSSQLLFREKTALVACIDNVGVDAIELAEMSNLKEDTIINKTLAKTVKDSTLCLPVGASLEGVATAWEAIKDAAKPCLMVCMPTSTVTMEYMYHLKAPKMQAKIVELVAECKKYTDCVQFVAMDATRAEPDYLVALAKAVKEAGACCMTLCDDAGDALPEDFVRMVKAIKGAVDIKLYVQANNAMNLAVGNALMAVAVGADGIKVTVNGKDTLTTEAFAGIIRKKGEDIGLTTDLKTTQLHSDIKEMLKALKHHHHVAETTSTMGGNIILDYDSTIADVKDAVLQLGYDLSAEDIGAVYERMHHICEKKSSVAGKELEAIIAADAMQVPSTYHIKNYTLTSSNLTPSVAQVTLIREDKELNGVSTGDGPIDAVLRAIEEAIGFHYELDDFQISSVTEGKEALGSCMVKLLNNGKSYVGNGTSTDTISAAVRSYVNALNKIAYDEENA